MQLIFGLMQAAILKSLSWECQLTEGTVAMAILNYIYGVTETYVMRIYHCLAEQS